MKKNIYISYIDSESMNFKNKITDRFKGRKYKYSETSYDLNNTSLTQDNDESLKLAKKISHTDVTVVLITRNILESVWIPIEVGYSLDVMTNSKVQPKLNGIIGVVIPDKGNDYSFMMKKGRKGIWLADQNKLPNIISSTRYLYHQL